MPGRKIRAEELVIGDTIIRRDGLWLNVLQVSHGRGRDSDVTEAKVQPADMAELTVAQSSSWLQFNGWAKVRVHRT